jgi:hypothetical protein
MVWGYTPLKWLMEVMKPPYNRLVFIGVIPTSTWLRSLTHEDLTSHHDITGIVIEFEQIPW